MFSSFTRSGLLTLALAAISTLAADISIKVTGPDTVTSVDDFSLKAVVTNHGAEPVTLLNDPNSVLTPHWKTNSFGISGPAGTAKFGGIKVKWSPELAAAHGKVTVLAPGQSIELEHDLAGLYNLTESGAGAYTIGANTDLHLVTESGELQTITAAVESHSVQVSGQLSSFKPAVVAPSTIRKRTVGYSSCSSSQKPLISTAANSAQTYLNEVNSYLSTMSTTSTRWKTWFGTYSSSHFNTVQSHYSHISGDPTATTYDCSCTESDTYAYTYPSQPGYVYLCGAFWQAPNTGTDSKAGTIIHEQSHFTNNGGTQDYQYGQSGCKSLAISNSNHAILNADSHEYFAENNPHQS